MEYMHFPIRQIKHCCKNSVIPATVKIIGDEAFEECSSLTSITIPENVMILAGRDCGRNAGGKVSCGARRKIRLPVFVIGVVCS